MTLRNRRSAYGALMDAVVVTPELEQRLLEAVTRRANRRPAVPAWRWLRLAALASAVCCVVLMVWSSYGVPPVTTTPPAVVQGGYGPVVYDDLQALTAVLSYPLRIPAALPEGYELSLVQSLPGELAELRWSDGTDTLCYRMAPGAGDISGDYNAYEAEWTQTVGAVPVDCRGDGGRIAAAVWSAEGFSYSVTSDAGLTPEALAALVESFGPV